MLLRLVQKREQIAKVVLMQLGPRDAEVLRALVHLRAVLPERGGQRDRVHAISAQRRSQRSAFGVSAVTAAASARVKQSLARLRRTGRLEVAECVEERH